MKKISVSFPTASRINRDINSPGPKEFFYGTDNLKKKYKVDYVNSRAEANNIFVKVLLFFEILINRFTKTGIYKSRVLLNQKNYKSSDIIISFTDAYSINVGLFHKKNKDQQLIGVFHGLSDFHGRVPLIFRKYFEKKISYSLKNLHYCLFLGDEDMFFSRKKYPFIKNKSDIFKFGVDHMFWRPVQLKETIDVFCVGSDINRDYEILKTICPSVRIKLLTSKKIDLNKNKNIELINGSFNQSLITDEQLRVFYNSAKIILIPLKNVFQPSGQSVALQAMSCGKTVVISQTKGLFDKILLKDKFNIIFIEPESLQSLNKTIIHLLGHESYRKKIGKSARTTVIENFTIKDMSTSLKKVLERI
jgi:glycosyltransferase involved in cell wall biosynthesis